MQMAVPNPDLTFLAGRDKRIGVRVMKYPSASLQLSASQGPGAGW